MIDLLVVLYSVPAVLWICLMLDPASVRRGVLLLAVTRSSTGSVLADQWSEIRDLAAYPDSLQLQSTATILSALLECEISYSILIGANGSGSREEGSGLACWPPSLTGEPSLTVSMEDYRGLSRWSFP